MTAVLSWFATHYGPSGSDQGGGSAYNSASADPLIAGLTGNGSPTDITTAIQVDIVKAEGGTPNRSPANQTFADQLLSFARTYQAPWSLKVALNSNGPYLAGTSYGGTLAINDKFGQRVPVRGINISATGQTNVAIDMAQGETTGDGSVTFTYTPSSDGPFDAQFVTSDVAGRAPIYEDTSAPGGYQRLMTPERADSSADLRGSVIPPNAVSGGLIVGKVNETGLVFLGGAVFNIFDITGQYRETVVTSDGSGTPGNELPTGIGVSSFDLQQGFYYILEVQAPPGYFPPPPFDPANPGTAYELNPANPFSMRQLQPVFAGQYTNSLFADLPLPGRFNFGKVDTQATVLTGAFVPLAGAVFRIDKCADASCTALTGETINTGPTDSTGTFFFPIDQGYFGLGYYLITEIVSPPGFVSSPPQIHQITPGRIMDVLFSNKHVPQGDDANLGSDSKRRGHDRRHH